MPKRKPRRISSRAHRISPKRKALYYSLLLIVSLIFFGIALGSSLSNANVLGEQTFLAKGGDDDGGDDSGDNSGSGGSGSSGGESSNSGSSGGIGSSTNTGTSENNGSVTTRTTPRIRTTISPKPTEVEDEDELDNEDDEEDENEAELPDEQINVRTKNDRTRIDITQNGIRVRLERRADRVIVKAEREDGTVVELEDDTLFKIDDRLAKSGIKVETAGDNEFFVQRGNTAALTSFPISLDLATNSLIINTPAGQKTVAVLPDVAVQNLLTANIVDRLSASVLPNTTTPLNVDQLVSLGEQNGVPVYEINGIDEQRLLGIIPVTIQKDVVVSAETGEVVTTKTSFVDRIIDLISF